MSSDIAEVHFDKLFAAIDAMDAGSFVSFVSEDCTFRFGSSPPVAGRDGIRASVDDFFSMFAALRHDLHRVITDDNGTVCEGEVTYTRHDGSQITLPFCNVFQTASGLITVYRIYIDMSPMFAE